MFDDNLQLKHDLLDWSWGTLSPWNQFSTVSVCIPPIHVRALCVEEPPISDVLTLTIA